MTLAAFPGIDPIPQPPALAGQGSWDTAQIPSDADELSAALLFAAVEAVVNRSNWQVRRAVNGLEGGSYDGTLVFTDLRTIASHTDTVDILGNADIQFNMHAQTGDITGQFVVLGTLFPTQIGWISGTMSGTLTDSTTCTRSGNHTITGRTKRSGANAWDGKRIGAVGPNIPSTNAVVTIQAEQFDTLEAPTLAFSGSWKLAAPTDSTAGIEITIIRASAGSPTLTLTILDADGATVVVLLPPATNLHRSILIRWTGSNWVVKSISIGTFVSGVLQA